MAARLYAGGWAATLKVPRLGPEEVRLGLQEPAAGAETGRGWCCQRARFRGAVGDVLGDGAGAKRTDAADLGTQRVTAGTLARPSYPRSRRLAPGCSSASTNLVSRG